ncbi:hypothetical protein [Flammeovirga sp. SubArs3]|uniref:hypothetical protein n=1 Tax=Flammeovirga sp. SubArs3 TaxID=2995316 RepID=UPI00248CEE7C|nr:hypothetical protein [Flammeovirga sp. SubArs3]
MKKNITFLLVAFFATLGSLWAQDSKTDKDSVTVKDTKYGEFFKNNLSVTIDARMDYRAYGETGQTDGFRAMDQKFQFSDFRFGINGMLTKNIGFSFLYSPTSTDIGESGISDDIQYANLWYQSDNGHWFFQAGKGFMNVGTMEQYYDPNDVYMWSIMGYNLGVYKTGVTAQYTTTSGQSFGAQILNSQETDSLGDQHNFEYNVYWYGYLIKDKITTTASFTVIDDKDDLNTSTPFSANVGLQWTFGDFIIDTDYAMSKNMPNFQDDALYQSMPIKVMYNGKHWKPYVKYIYNNVRFDQPTMTVADGEAVYDANINQIEIALQYYPWEGKNIRFHVVGMYMDDANSYYGDGIVNSKPNTSHYQGDFQVMAGVRIGFDVLKGWK